MAFANLIFYSRSRISIENQDTVRVERLYRRIAIPEEGGSETKLIRLGSDLVDGIKMTVVFVKYLLHQPRNIERGRITCVHTGSLVV